MMSKIIELAKKLNELARRGEGGEKENATKMLQLFMRKHGLCDADIEMDEILPFDIVVKKDQGAFFVQLCSSVRSGMWVSVQSGRIRRVKCTNAEYVEVCEKFRVLWSHYQSEMDLFYRSFVQANKMYSKPKERNDDDEEQEDTRTPEQRARDRRVAEMSMSIEIKTIHKQLN